MNSKMKSMLLMGVALSAMAQTDTNTHYDGHPILKREKRQPKKIIPKGCKEYFFNDIGKISTERPEVRDCIFECIATSEKSAQKKFDKWMAEQSNNRSKS